MRVSKQRFWRRIGAAVVTIMGLAGPVAAQSSDEIGRWLAERFADDSSHSKVVGKTHKIEPAPAPAAADEQRIIEEIEMLERARSEAEARREALSGTRDAALPVQGAAPEAVQRDAEAQRSAQERDHAEQAARRAEDARKAEDERRLADERKRAEEAARKAEAERKAEEAELAQMEAEREAEAERIDAALRKARAAREARDRQLPPSSDDAIRGETSRDSHSDVREVRGSAESFGDRQPPTLSIPEREAPSDVRAAGAHTRNETIVTVLMTMEPGNRGIRRHNKTADPLLCGERGCYVGAGADAPAEFLPRRRAFGPGQTLGDRAGACRNSLGCVFRSVDLVAYPAAVQPIDMRFLRHDRRQPLVLTEASDCRLARGRLACTGLHGPDYTIWIVPERLAEAAGAAELERVISAGLADSETAAVPVSRD